MAASERGGSGGGEGEGERERGGRGGRGERDGGSLKHGGLYNTTSGGPTCYPPTLPFLPW